jgi:hypothetical protein
LLVIVTKNIKIYHQNLSLQYLTRGRLSRLQVAQVAFDLMVSLLPGPKPKSFNCPKMIIMPFLAIFGVHG